MTGCKGGDVIFLCLIIMLFFICATVNFMIKMQTVEICNEVSG